MRNIVNNHTYKLIAALETIIDRVDVESFSPVVSGREIIPYSRNTEELTTLVCLRVNDALGIECKDEEENKFIDQNTFIKDEPLAKLLDDLQQADNGNITWTSEICTSPIEYFQWFEGAETMEEFSCKNKLDYPSERIIELKILEDFAKEVNPEQICVLGLYPSGCLRSLPVNVKRRDGKLILTLTNQIILLDPDEEESIEEIRSFIARIIIFAIRCPN